jgi:hypothetical protein
MAMLLNAVPTPSLSLSGSTGMRWRSDGRRHGVPGVRAWQFIAVRGKPKPPERLPE